MSSFVNVLYGLPRTMRFAFFLVVFMAIVSSGAWLATALAGSRYEYREVSTAPSRSILYRIDRWTGTTVRCHYTTGAGPVC